MTDKELNEWFEKGLNDQELWNYYCSDELQDQVSEYWLSHYTEW